MIQLHANVCSQERGGEGQVSWLVGWVAIRTLGLSYDPDFRLTEVLKVLYCTIIWENASMTLNGFVRQLGSRYPYEGRCCVMSR